ncbi:MAG: hypothetical protein NUV54_01390 [Candidatus Taylorbacteria bacterium]|nr:hypothetical protein [Candidatus Taylorbacteria bacterium]
MTAINKDGTEISKTEQRDRDLPLPQLVEKVGSDVLGNPYLASFISTAPSAKSADEEMIRMGWPNVLARKVRLGVYVRDKCRLLGKNAWPEMTKITQRPAEQMLEFGFEPTKPTFQHLVDIRWSNTFRLGDFKSSHTRPLFLRDVCFKKVAWKENYRTSFDGLGLDEHDWQNRFDVVHDLFDPEDHHLTVFGEEDEGFTEHTGGDAFLTVHPSRSARSAFFRVRVGQENSTLIIMRTKTVVLEPKQDRLFPRCFPRLYKVLESMKQCREGERMANERIRILLRQDLGPKVDHNSFMDEWVTYERRVSVSEKMEVVLEARYRLHPNRSHLMRIDRDAIPIQFRIKHEGVRMEKGHWEDPQIVKTIQRFASIAAPMFSCSSMEVELETVAGLSLVTNPPKELAELFTRERSELIRNMK